MWKGWTGALVTAVAFAGLTTPAHAVAQEGDAAGVTQQAATGSWTLNAALSDDPEEQLANVRGAQPPPGVRRDGRPPEGSTPFDPVRRAVEGFEMAFTDSTVTIRYPDRDLELHTDGRQQEVQLDEERTIQYRSWWDEGRLHLERSLDGGIRLTERYTVQEGTGRLHVLTRLEGDRLPRTIAFVRVYDRS